MEIFDLYDKNFNKLNKTMPRGGQNKRGEYHLVTHIWIRNNKNQYLIQQRNKLEDPIPFQWAATGGAVLKDESSLEGTLRELKEELGYEFIPKDLKLVKRYFIEHDKANYITDLYLIDKQIELNEFIIDETEVKSIEYKTMNEIKEMIEKNLFWDYTHNLVREDYFDILEKS